MKNILLSVCTLLFISGSVAAQISLVSSGYTTSPIGIDSLEVTATTSTFPSFAPATNATWDLTTLTEASGVTLDYNVAAPAPATYADSGYSSFGGYSYQVNVQTAIAGSGLLQYGLNIIGSTNPTGTAGDTLFIPSQNDTFSSARTLIKFPATMSASWMSSYVEGFNYFISYLMPPVPAFVHSPATVKGFVTEKDTVIGWGQMRVKTITGAPSGYVNVLRVRINRSTADSFYLDGSATDPELPALLSLFGTTQGHVTNTYTQNFYRIDNITPLATVAFIDSANTLPTKVTTNVQRLSPNAVKTVMNDNHIAAYPNPVTGNAITVILPATAGAWSYELIDLNGRKVQDGPLPSNGNEAQITLSSTIINGIYYLKVNNTGSRATTTPIEVAR